MGDAMTAAEARGLLAVLDAERRRCSECGAPGAEADAEGRHVDCPAPDVVGYVGAWRRCLGPEESARALRAVIALHEAARVPPHGAVVYRGDRLPPRLAARVEGAEGAALVVEYRDPDAPGAGPAEWDSRAAAKRAAGLGDATWCGVTEGTGVVVVHDGPAQPRGGG